MYIFFEKQVLEFLSSYSHADTQPFFQLCKISTYSFFLIWKHICFRGIIFIESYLKIEKKGEDNTNYLLSMESEKCITNKKINIFFSR